MRRSGRRAASVREICLVALMAVACSAAAASRRPAVGVPSSASPTKSVRSLRDASSRVVRIELADAQSRVNLTSAGGWRMYGADGTTPVALPQPGERWVLERDGRDIRALREDSRPVSARELTVIVRPTDEAGDITFNGKRWRGELVITTASEGLRVVNRLLMDEYLKGVVPLEIGVTSTLEEAAAEAQAVTARSYAVTHLAGESRPYDMRATVLDQVYGGVNAETRVGNFAVEATTGLVLLYAGRVVNAPYSSTCGGSTAEPEDVWNASPEPYLRRVSDQIPGSTHFYCENAPRYRWMRHFSRDDLRENIVRYVRTLGGKGATLTTVRSVTVTDVTPAGRVGILTVQTDRGTVTLHGNEMRSALRLVSGDLLYSTYFSVEGVTGPDGVETLTLHGGGNGHGVGMCQAGAIGRARAGQDYRTILRTYYPGTSVGTIG